MHYKIECYGEKPKGGFLSSRDFDPSEINRIRGGIEAIISGHDIGSGLRRTGRGPYLGQGTVIFAGHLSSKIVRSAYKPKKTARFDVRGVLGDNAAQKGADLAEKLQRYMNEQGLVVTDESGKITQDEYINLLKGFGYYRPT